ncbi:MAG TPA: ATP-binding protein [Glaciihabitans sp.]|nr:ATP-binding protein [Glaciihabitans sp.]
MPVTSWMLRRGSLLLLQVAIVFLCVSVTTVFAVRVQEDRIRANTVERVTAVAQSLASLPAVINGIGADDATEVLQPLTDIVREASAVDYVVITDADGIRITHPNPAMVGEVVSTDPSAVLRGETFVGTEEGTLGYTLRAKVPILDNGVVIGTASVGLLESRIAADLEASIWQLAPWVLGSLAVGFIGAAAVDRAMRRRVAQLESDARELETQRRLAEALRDQTHEFANRMHVLYGLVEANEPAEALTFIESIVPVTSGSDPLLDDPRLDAVLTARSAELARGGGMLRLNDASRVDSAAVTDTAVTITANLVANAVEATDAAGTVEVTVIASDSGFSVTVGDNGPGVDPAVRSQIFDRGVSTKEREQRSGIEIPRGVGLALVRDLVDRAGGQLDVGESTLGGARFTVTLPALTAGVRR